MSEAPPGQPIGARFVTGSTMNHVVVMTLTSAVGLMAMFLVDLADLWFLTLLKRIEVTAAIGFAGTVVFANLSVGLGLAIAAGARVAQAMGRGDEDDARKTAASAFVLTLAGGLAMAVLIAACAGQLLTLLGADGEVRRLARSYLWVIAPGFAMLAGGITVSFVLRAIGDPRRAMYVTLMTAIANAVLDPVFIFGLGMGMNGAALATVCANFLALATGLFCLHVYHRFVVRPDWQSLQGAFRPIMRIAVPAIATQLATPFAIAYMTRVTAAFGDDVVAGVAIVNRIVPVAFGIIFSLSGAVGPIIGQNYGAGRLDRVRQTLVDGMTFCAIYTLGVSILLFILSGYLPHWFSASPRAADIVTFFYTFVAVTWTFSGIQFVSQAAFNNLDKAHWSTGFNWGKATLGTIPFLHAGAVLGGAEGAVMGMGAGNVIFGIAAAAASFVLVRRLGEAELTGERT